jgi:transposase
VELPAPRAQGPRAQRGVDSTLGAVSLAPDQKKAREAKALLIFLDESGFSERPSVRRTWAPRGETPILVAPFNWKRLSAIASLITTPSARRVGLCLRLQPGTVKQPQILEYLTALKRHVRGRKVILLWDRLPAHRGAQVRAWIARQHRWLTTEYLPPSAPELNPVEYFWSHLSRTDMAQFVGEDLDTVRKQARKAASRVRHRPDLGKAFLKHSGLF